MATRSEKIAGYSEKKRAAMERLGILESKAASTKALIATCEAKIREAQDDAPVPAPAKTPDKKG